MDAYSRLYQDPELFSDLFPDFEERQLNGAKQLWDRIFKRCGQVPGMPQISSIVDLGCGDGTLTLALADAAERDNCAVQVVGVDCSEPAVRLAQSKCNRRSNCAFILADAGTAAVFHTLATDHGIDWSTAAVVCLSHTWFHLNQEGLLAGLRQAQPALLLIDVFESWDVALTKLRTLPETLEHGRLHNGSAFFLKSVLRSGNAGMVTRGIWKLPFEAGEPRGEWIAATEQYRISTRELIGEEDQEDVRTLERSLAAQHNEPANNPVCILDNCISPGILTGKSADYLQRRLVRHTSGWGEMLCHALVRRDALAADLNRAYFDVISRLVRRLFVHTAGDLDVFKHLRDTLAVFNEDETWQDKNKPCKGSREALIVLPFDPHTTFARALGLFEGVDDQAISQRDLIVEEANRIQIRFPTAYGLFHTLEDEISSPQAFPLKWAPDYDRARADVAFSILEDALLKIETFKDRDANYFMLLVYFGSLPLFTLALKFPRLFAPEATDFQLYFAGLANVHKEITVALTDEVVQIDILRPWVETALRAVSKKSAPEHTGSDSIETHLNILETALFGKAVAPDAGGHDRGRFRLGGEAGHWRSGGVLGKEWKSWLLGVPSFPIKKLRVVEAENTRLWNLWRVEKLRAERDDELRLSRWFEEAEFFSDDDGAGHENWICRAHLPRLRRMFEVAGFGLPAFISETDDSWLPSALTELTSLTNEQDGQGHNTHARNYFGRCRNRFLFNWMVGVLARLYEAKSSCPGREVDCVMRENVAECVRNVECFGQLKAVFCKSLGNRGEKVRFGLRRLWCLLRAAAGPKTELTPPDEFCWKLKSLGLESKHWSRKDPSMKIADFVDSLRQLTSFGGHYLTGIVPSCDTVPGQSRKAGITVVIDIMCALQRSCGGTECDRVAVAFGEIPAFVVKPDSIYELRQFTLGFSVVATDHGIDFDRYPT